MQHCGTIDRSAVLPKAAPLFARLLSKLVLEVLPASLASVIGAMLLAHYQFGHPSMSAGGMVATVQAPASPEMLQLVRDEHDLIRDLIMAQQAAQAGRYATADARAKQAAVDAELAAAIARHPVDAVAAKPPETRAKIAASLPAAPAPAAAMPAVAAAPQALPAFAGLPNSAAPIPPAEHRSLVARIVHAPLHAVMAIGGIPSWLGHRLGSDDAESGEQMFSAAS
jgi:hypothetical protein